MDLIEKYHIPRYTTLNIRSADLLIAPSDAKDRHTFSVNIDNVLPHDDYNEHYIRLKKFFICQYANLETLIDEYASDPASFNNTWGLCCAAIEMTIDNKSTITYNTDSQRGGCSIYKAVVMVKTGSAEDTSSEDNFFCGGLDAWQNYPLMRISSDFVNNTLWDFRLTTLCPNKTLGLTQRINIGYYSNSNTGSLTLFVNVPNIFFQFEIISYKNKLYLERPLINKRYVYITNIDALQSISDISATNNAGYYSVRLAGLPEMIGEKGALIRVISAGCFNRIPDMFYGPRYDGEGAAYNKQICLIPGDFHLYRMDIIFNGTIQNQLTSEFGNTSRLITYLNPWQSGDDRFKQGMMDGNIHQGNFIISKIHSDVVNIRIYVYSGGRWITPYLGSTNYNYASSACLEIEPL